MKRLIDNTLAKWKDSMFRKPLIVRGARSTPIIYQLLAWTDHLPIVFMKN